MSILSAYVLITILARRRWSLDCLYYYSFMILGHISHFVLHVFSNFIKNELLACPSLVLFLFLYFCPAFPNHTFVRIKSPGRRRWSAGGTIWRSSLCDWSALIWVGSGEYFRYMFISVWRLHKNCVILVMDCQPYQLTCWEACNDLKGSVFEILKFSTFIWMWFV